MTRRGFLGGMIGAIAGACAVKAEWFAAPYADVIVHTPIRMPDGSLGRVRELIGYEMRAVVLAKGDYAGTVAWLETHTPLPDGYLECDGQPFEVSEHPDLAFAYLGCHHPCHTPDLRGRGLSGGPRDVEVSRLNAI